MYLPRIVCFFDILGFRDFVLTHDLQDVIISFNAVFNSVYSAHKRLMMRRISASMNPETIQTWIKENINDEQPSSRKVLEDFERETKWGTLLLSDSVLLYSDEISEQPPLEPLTDAILISRIITMQFFRQRLPIRGAISFGEFYVNREENIYCGKGLVEAYELAESQQWVGTVIAPSAEEYATELMKNFQKRSDFSKIWSVRPGWDLIRWKIPLKSSSREGWVVNWASAWNAGGPVRDDLFDSRLTGDPQVDQKYLNTLRFLQEWPRKWGKFKSFNAG